MRFLRRRREKTSTGFVPLVSAGGFEKSDKCETSADDKTRAESKAFINADAPYEPPVFKHSNKSQSLKVEKRLEEERFTNKENVEPKHGKSEKDNESNDAVDGSIITTSTARMTDNEEDVRPVLISVKDTELQESMNSPGTLFTPKFASITRKTGSSFDSQGAFSQDPFKISPGSPGFPTSPLSVTKADRSVTALSATGTVNESIAETMNESTMTGVSTLDSWDDTSTRYTRDDSEFDVTTIGSESQATRRSKKRAASWIAPEKLPKATKDAIFFVQDMIEDLTFCGAYVAKTAENTVCGPENEEPRVQVWKKKKRMSKSEEKKAHSDEEK
mmetsp:Transcript_8274/g.12733  ORF Transcript_8274/g.12733 Transcript_8274/m.12733 type:complete len:331 (-) Transcript_8274:52-1044(-)